MYRLLYLSTYLSDLAAENFPLITITFTAELSRALD
jgi:hypothetical protein